MITLSPSQQLALRLFESKQNLLITGPAGTGKSYLLNHIKGISKISITASTGIAAIQIEGMTINAWAGLGVGTDNIVYLAEDIKRREGKPYSRIRNCEILAIDEISMLSAEVLDQLDYLMQAVRENSHPFGGVQIVCFGDFLQLPPVKGKFAFYSKAWKEANFKVVTLKEVFRQQDAEFVDLLNSLRFGIVEDRHEKIILSCEKPYRKRKVQPIRLFSTNKKIDTFNNKRFEQLGGSAVAYKAFDTGIEPFLSQLKSSCLAPEVLELKTGAQVMLLKNVNVGEGLANGLTGVVQECKDDRVVVDFEEYGESSIERNRWAITELQPDGKRIELASRDQIPLRLCYGMSIHKSQGMSLNIAEIFLTNIFAPGQAYVAISRVRSLDGLYLREYKRNKIFPNPDAVKFYVGNQVNL